MMECRGLFKNFFLKKELRVLLLKKLRIMGLLQKINHNYGGYARELATNLAASVQNTKKHSQKFILFGRGRTGSTLLTDLLNSSNEVACDKEVFNRPVAFPQTYLKSREKLFHKPVYGFKLLSYQLRNFLQPDDPHEFLHYLSEDLGYKIIFLRRENILRQILSKHYAVHRNAWHDKGNSKHRPKMKVNTNELITHLQEGQILERYEEEALSGLDYLTITYENDLNSIETQKETIARVREYLGLEHFEANTDLRKITASKLEDFIENMEELREALKGSRYRDMVES
tara:strand:- start:165 stop:1022 length:858 start_codon:yes stop_codon:yes gene_type:complete